MEKTIKIIKIDVERQEVTEQIIDKSLASYYNQIGNGCDLVQVATYLRSRNGSRYGDAVYVDEEGLLKSIKGAFQLNNNVYVGNAIIVGSMETEEGVESCDTSYTAQDIQTMVRFINV
jgi:hypothetical protein